MTTLLTMKTRIADELRRTNASFAPKIADAITTAIEAYQDERTFFNESRDKTFTTSSGQAYYGAATTPVAWADAANLIKIDYVTITVGGNQHEIYQEDPKVVDAWTNDATATGEPGWFSYYDQKIRLYPIPNDAWVVRVPGVYKYAAPASDSETGNYWMTVAERLIRSRAKLELAVHVLIDDALASKMGLAATEAYDQLKRRTNRVTKTNGGRVKAMNF